MERSESRQAKHVGIIGAIGRLCCTVDNVNMLATEIELGSAERATAEDKGTPTTSLADFLNNSEKEINEIRDNLEVSLTRIREILF